MLKLSLILWKLYKNDNESAPAVLVKCRSLSDGMNCVPCIVWRLEENENEEELIHDAHSKRKSPDLKNETHIYFRFTSNER